MATKLLDETRIHALHQAALDAGLAAARADLLRGLDASFVASLPVSSSLSAQLFTDLHELCITLHDGSVPIVAWLKTSFASPAEEPRAWSSRRRSRTWATRFPRARLPRLRTAHARAKHGTVAR
jgi:hypothetical protein